MISVVAISIVALILFGLAAQRIGLLEICMFLFILTTALYPRQLTGWSETQYTGMAAQSPELHLFTLALIAFALALVVSGRLPVPRMLVPLVLWLFIGTIFAWNRSTYVDAGLLQLGLGLVALSAGLWVGRELQTRRNLPRQLLIAVALVVVVQTIVSVAQLAGLPLFPMDPSTAALMGSRVNGTMNHPNNLGKVLLLCITLAIPFTRVNDRRVRRLAYGIVVVSILPLLLTGGRANAIAALATILLFTMLSRGGSGKALLPVVLLAIVAPFAGAFAARFEEDPSGGSRDGLVQVAFRQLALHPFEGVGPNSYLAVVRERDFLTAATGLPVHNSFLLLAVEIGVIGVIALFFPFLIWARTAWKRRKADDEYATFAVGYLACLPGLTIVGATGWGMTSGTIFPLWFFMLGLLVGGFTIQRARATESPVTSQLVRATR